VPAVASVLELGGGGRAPLWQYFSKAKKKQWSPLLPPKGTDPRTLWLFPCKPAVFRGPPEGAMIATMDPWQADAVVVGEGHAPLWQYFFRLRQT
jgi:hypothetical protein